MKSIFEITRYKVRILLNSSKYITPSICFVFLLYSVYSEASYNIVSTFAITLGIQFIVGVWFGHICNELEYPVIEQLILLKVKKRYFYDLSEVFLFLCLALIMSFLVVLYPITLYLMQQSVIKLSDIGIGLLIHIPVGVMALGVGSFFHPRLIKSQKNITLLVLAVTLLGFAKASIINERMIWSALTRVLPPISEILYLLKGLNGFTTPIVFRVICISVGYYSILKLIKTMLLNHVKF